MEQTESELMERFMREAAELPAVMMVLTPIGREEDAMALSPAAVWVLIANLQLAMRHPNNDGPGRMKVEWLLEWIRMVTIPPGTAMEEVFRRGFDPAYDTVRAIQNAPKA